MSEAKALIQVIIHLVNELQADLMAEVKADQIMTMKPAAVEEAEQIYVLAVFHLVIE